MAVAESECFTGEAGFNPKRESITGHVHGHRERVCIRSVDRGWAARVYATSSAYGLFNIDVNVNAVYILLLLLNGEGDSRAHDVTVTRTVVILL